MKKLQETLDEVTKMTTLIETNYPELYRFLDENPLTIPFDNDLEINESDMRNYLESLEEMLKHYLKTHKKQLGNLQTDSY